MKKNGSLIRRAAVRRLRNIALKAKDGDFLGSELELMAQLGVSRPTFRQAVRLLEHEQLVRVKMGPHGGCYARRPQIESVIHAAATFLQVEHATLQEMLGVSNMLTLHAVTLACACTDKKKRQALKAFLERLDSYPIKLSEEEFLKIDAEFNALIRAMAMNSTLDLFLRVIHKFIDFNPASHVLIESERLRRARRRHWVELATAVLNRDHALAEEISARQFNIYSRLFSPDALKTAAIAQDTSFDPALP